MTHHAIRDWLLRNTSLDPSLLEGPGFERLVQERLKQRGLEDTEAYIDALDRSPAEVEELVLSVAVPETWLFRYPESFALLADHLANLRARRPDSGPVRLLSAACAAGQEACSMAITALHAGWPPDRVVVHAIDINARLIDEARRGKYGTRSVRDGLPQWARTWISTSDDTVKMRPPVAASIIYHHGDILRANGLGVPQKFDVIFCRNLLIYLNPDARRRLETWIAGALAPDGLLFVGHAERGTLANRRFESVPRPHAFALRVATPEKQTQRQTPSPMPQTPPTPVVRPGSRRSVRPARRTARKPLHTAPTTGSPASLARAQAEANRGELEEARRIAEAVLSSEGPNVAVLELLGTVQMAMGDVAAARECFRKAVYLEPDREASLLQLSLISEQMGNPEQARRYRKRAGDVHRRSSVSDETTHES
jgi:chemotaxis protein methyltransferase WspC